MSWWVFYWNNDAIHAGSCIIRWKCEYRKIKSGKKFIVQRDGMSAAEKKLYVGVLWSRDREKKKFLSLYLNERKWKKRKDGPLENIKKYFFPKKNNLNNF